MKKSYRPLMIWLAIFAGVGAFAVNAFASPLIIVCYMGQKRTIQSHLLPRYVAADPSTVQINISDPCPVVVSGGG